MPSIPRVVMPSIPKISSRNSPPTSLRDHLHGCRRVTDPHMHTVCGILSHPGQPLDILLNGMAS